MPGYGWLKDKHNPQAVYHRPKVVKLPPSISWIQFCPPVRNQGNVGACTGFGIGGMAYTIANQLKIALLDVFGPTWLYNGARDLEGTLAFDLGANPEDVFKWATLYGFLYERYWQYDPTKLDKSAPGSTRMSEAIDFKLQAIRVDNGIDGIMSALATVPAVAIGVPWPAEWENYSGGVLPIPTPSSKVAGGHETFLYGFDQSGKFVNGQNSWDTSWGIGGRYQMPFEAFDWFKANGGYDAHYAVMADPGPQPSPPPPPPPGPGCLLNFWPFRNRKRS